MKKHSYGCYPSGYPGDALAFHALLLYNLQAACSLVDFQMPSSNTYTPLVTLLKAKHKTGRAGSQWMTGVVCGIVAVDRTRQWL